MKLHTNCHTCNHEINVQPVVDNRIDLEKIKGTPFQLRCIACNTISGYHVNEVKAIESKSIKLIALFIFVVGTLLMVALMVGGFLGLGSFYDVLTGTSLPLFPVFIYIVLIKGEQKKVLLFNRCWK